MTLGKKLHVIVQVSWERELEVNMLILLGRHLEMANLGKTYFLLFGSSQGQNFQGDGFT